jgi:mevalonate kinase
LDAVGALMDEANAALASIDPQSWPPHLTQIVDAIRPHLSGAKPAGAGGGGFLMFMAKSAEDRLQAEAILSQLDLPPGARAYPLEVAEDGLQVFTTGGPEGVRG